MILERDEETAEFALDEVDLDEDTKKSLFVYEAMRKAHDPLTNTIQDVQIDLSDLKLAPNFYKYCRETVGSKVKMPFARQLWLAYRFFGEYCIAGGTKLFSEHGLVPIEFLESRLGLHPHASVVSTLKGNWPTSHAGMTKRKAECVRVIAAGHGITCTPNHKMLVWNSDARLVWKQAQRLTSTDYLVTPLGMNLWPATPASTTTGPVTPELARFIGYTITNGSFSKRTASPRYPDKLYYYVEFCTPDESIAKDWAHCVKQLFGLTPRLVCKTPRTGKLPVFSSSFCSLAAGTWLEENGFLPGDCYTKKVPQFILSSTKELVIEFVRACFDCDGYIQKGRVGITLANPGVVHDLGLLLQNLGVYGVKKLSLLNSANNKAIKIPRERNDFRNRRVSWEAKGEYATLFCALVGTLNSSRREVCSSNINSRIKSPRFCSVRRNARPGQLPNTQSLYNRLRGLYPRETYHDSQFRKKLGHLRRSNSCQLDSLDLDFIHELSPQEAHSLSYLKEVKYAFRKVERVSPAGYHDVYDLTVPKNSSFVANGLVVHNCPRCSDPAYNDITHIEVDAEPEEVLEHVVLLNNGRCPSCGARKSQLILSNEMCDYNELVMVLGQRCLVGSTNVFTQDGLMKIEEYAEGRKEGFSPFTLPVFNGHELEQTSDFFKSSPEFALKLRLRNGFEVVGTKDHPVYTLEGFKPLGSVTEEDYVKVSWGQNVFGNKSVPLRVVYEKAVKAFDALPESNRRFLRTAFKADLPVLDANLSTLMGLWVAEGRGAGISNTCPEVLAFSEEQLLRLVNGRYIAFVGREETKGIKVRGRLFAEFWKELLGVDDLFSGSAHKEIPLSIRQGSKECVTGFLRGLYEGDGGVEGAGVSYTTISKELAQQVSSCLSNLGIRNRKGYFSTWASNGGENQVSKPGYSVWVHGPDLAKFREEIGFLSTRKKHALDRVIARHVDREKLMPFYEDVLPDPVKREFLAFVDRTIDRLRHLPLPKELMTYKILTRVRSTKRIGFATVFGLSNSEPKIRANGSVCLDLCDMVNRMRDPNVSLSKKKLRTLLEALRQFSHFLPTRSLAGLSYFESYLDENSAFIQVKKVGHSKKEVVTYDFTLPRTHTFWANGIINHNSGKSTLASMMSSYQVHRYLKVPRLSTLCGGIQDFTPVQGTFVGLTFARAIKNLWSPFSSIIERSEWFQEYHAALTHYGNQMGKELFRQSTQFLRYNHLNLEYYPSGPLKRTLRGDTRSLAAIDELGWFPFDLTKEEEQLDTEEDERERANADEVHVSLSNSLATLRTEMWGLYKRGIDHIPTALMLNMSSPSSWKDKICRLLKEADGSRFMLGLRMPTWEINPIYSKDHPLIAEMYRKNPIKADRDFGANPPSLSSSIYSKNTVQRLFSGRHHHVLAPELVDSVIDGEERRIYGKAVTKYERASWPSGILALDAGSVNNSFSMVHAFMEGSVLVVASVMEVIPTGGRKVDFRQLMKHCLYVLISQCNIHCVVADRWNSILLLQDVEKEFPKCMTQQYTLKAKDFSTFNSDFIETGNLVLPSLELPVEQIETVRNYKQELNGYPASHLYLQFLTVRELQGIVTKGDGFTDDIYRALVLAASRIRDKKIAEHLVSFAPRERKMGDFSSKIIIAGRSGLNITSTSHLYN